MRWGKDAIFFQDFLKPVVLSNIKLSKFLETMLGKKFLVRSKSSCQIYHLMGMIGTFQGPSDGKGSYTSCPDCLNYKQPSMKRSVMPSVRTVPSSFFTPTLGFSLPSYNWMLDASKFQAEAPSATSLPPRIPCP